MKTARTLVTLCSIMMFFHQAVLCQSHWVPEAPWMWTGLSVQNQNEVLDPELQSPFDPAAPWHQTMRDGDIVYFLYRSPARIERYDIAAEAWLSVVFLDPLPTAFAVDSSYYYIAYDRALYRTDHDGGNATHLGNTGSEITLILSEGNLVFIWSGTTITCRDAVSGTQLDQKDYSYYTPRGASIARSQNAIFGRTSGISPSDIVKITYTNEGALSGSQDSPYHGDYPGASWAEILPGETRVVDSAGIVYQSNNLTYANSMAGAIHDVAHEENTTVIRRNNTLMLLTEDFNTSATATPPVTILDYHVYGSEVIVFYRGTASILTLNVSLADFQPPAPAPPVNPANLAYVPEKIILGDDGIVYLLSKTHKNVFRWSVSQWRYLDSLGLNDEPSYMAYSANNASLYFAYPSGRLTRYLTSLAGGEQFLANLAMSPLGLSTAGPYIFACDASGAWESHSTYAHSGERIDWKEWNYPSRVFVWSPANGRMYHFRDGTSPNDILWEIINSDGTIGAQHDSPEHGGVDVSLPLSVSPDGGRVLTGQGVIRDGITLAIQDYLANAINAATWNGGTLYTMRTQNGRSEIQKWGLFYNIEMSKNLAGTTLELFTLPDGLLAVTLRDGVPTFHKMDFELNQSSYVLLF